MKRSTCISVGFDINITELDDVFLVEIGSEAGRMVIGELQFTPASAFLLQAAKLWLDEACNQMGRELLNPQNLPSILLDSLDHPQWEDVAKRCLSCASCTQVCPTCVCWDIHEKPDLTNLRHSSPKVVHGTGNFYGDVFWKLKARRVSARAVWPKRLATMPPSVVTGRIFTIAS